MKFATIALIATVAAIQTNCEADLEEYADFEAQDYLELEEDGEENALAETEAEVGKPCVSKKDSDRIFDLVDTHKTGALHPRQIYSGIKAMASSTNNCIDRKKSQWVMKAANLKTVKKAHNKTKFWKFN